MHDEDTGTTPASEPDPHVQRMANIVGRLVSAGSTFKRSLAVMEKDRAELHAAMREARDAGLMYNVIIAMSGSTQHHYTTALKEKDSA